MRLAHSILSMIILLGIAIASMYAGPLQTNISLNNLDTESLSSLNVAFPSRRLRSYDAPHVAGDKDEEKIGISYLSKITEQWTFNLLLKLKTNPETLFIKWRLGQFDGKLDDNPVFIRWLQYINQYRGEKSYKFSEFDIFKLLRQSQSEDDLVTLFQNLRQVPDVKNLAGSLQEVLFWRSPSTRKLMNEAWLKHGESPQEVLKILRPALEVDNQAFLSWLRYTELYRAKMGANSFSELQTLHVLLELPRFQSEPKLGILFQSIREVPDLKNIAESMQTHLFSRWMHVEKANPEKFGNFLVDHSIDRYGTWRSIFMHKKSDADFRTLEAYTLKYAKDLGGTAMLKRVETLFANNDPEGAVAAAMKVSYPLSS